MRADRRIMLHEIFTNIMGTQNEVLSRVYFQPPADVKLKYPCIVYNRIFTDTQRANDELYGFRTCYTAMVIDPNPDSPIPEKILRLPLCSHDRQYTANNLNHDVFTIYY